MIKYIIYILLFALATVIIYSWGIIKSQNKQKDLMSILYSNGQKKIIKKLKQNETISKSDIENTVKDLKASLFYSKNKIVVTDAKLFSKNLIQIMLENGIIEESTKNSKIYKLKDKK